MKKYILIIPLLAAGACAHAQLTSSSATTATGLPEQESSQGFAQGSLPMGAATVAQNAYDDSTAGRWIGSQSYGVNRLSTSAWEGTRREKVGPVISFGKLDQKALDEMTEDLNVLALIVARHVERLGADQPDYKLGIPILVNGQSAIHASYIEGFGAILSFHVPFPLIAPGPVSASNAPPQKDTEWDKARLSIYGGASESGSQGVFQQRVQPGAESPAFNADLVAQLRKLTVDALKNAGHLRHLAASEVIAVTITGTHSTPDGGEAHRPTMMTIRVDKAGAEAAAANNASADQFESQVARHTYLGVNANSQEDVRLDGGHAAIGGDASLARNSGADAPLFRRLVSRL